MSLSKTLVGTDNPTLAINAAIRESQATGSELWVVYHDALGYITRTPEASRRLGLAPIYRAGRKDPPGSTPRNYPKRERKVRRFTRPNWGQVLRFGTELLVVLAAIAAILVIFGVYVPAIQAYASHQ